MHLYFIIVVLYIIVYGKFMENEKYLFIKSII